MTASLEGMAQIQQRRKKLPVPSFLLQHNSDYPMLLIWSLRGVFLERYMIMNTKRAGKSEHVSWIANTLLSQTLNTFGDMRSVLTR